MRMANIKNIGHLLVLNSGSVDGHEEIKGLLKVLLNVSLLLLARDEIVPQGIIGIHDLDEVHFHQILTLLELKKLGEDGLSLWQSIIIVIKSHTLG